MSVADPELRQTLLALIAEDDRVRARLVGEGTLFDGYHPEMEAVHARNADALEEILEVRGFPGASLVGEDGAEAAWRILQHAISRPSLLHRALPIVEAAAARGELPRASVAFLTDRIRMFGGRPQLYGTQHDWIDGELRPIPIEDEDRVDVRRAAMGLEPLAVATARLRERAARDGERPPRDPAARRREFEDWARRTGWRD